MRNDIVDSLGADISLMGSKICDELKDILDDLELELENALDINELMRV